MNGQQSQETTSTNTIEENELGEYKRGQKNLKARQNLQKSVSAIFKVTFPKSQNLLCTKTLHMLQTPTILMMFLLIDPQPRTSDLMVDPGNKFRKTKT